MQSEWSIDEIDALPEVGILYAHGGMNDAMVRAMLDSGVKALIYAATGNGNVATSVVASLVNARLRGIHVVRGSRTGSGVVIRNAAQPDDRYDWLVTDDQVPHKARILMMLALTGKHCTRKLQNAFLTY